MRLEWPLQVILAFIGSSCGGILTNVPRRALTACGAVGVLAWGEAAALQGWGMTAVGATFVAALTVAVAGEILARLMHLPAICFAVPGVIPLAPGVSAYESMYRFVVNDTVAGSEYAFHAVFVSAAIAAGVVLAGTVFRVWGAVK